LEMAADSSKVFVQMVDVQENSEGYRAMSF
jgi:hypothetical protein